MNDRQWFERMFKEIRKDGKKNGLSEKEIDKKISEFKRQFGYWKVIG